MEIPLKHGHMVVIDEADFESVSQYNWYATNTAKPGNQPTWYVKTDLKKPDGRWTSLYLHRFLTGSDRGTYIDHINGNGLDNRRANLRNATKAQNARNSKKPLTNKTGFKGVSKNQKTGKYIARIKANYCTIELGSFDTAYDASKAYDEGARKYHKDFARPNAAPECPGEAKKWGITSDGLLYL